MNLKFLIRHASIKPSIDGGGNLHLHFSEAFSCETQSKLMATALILEAIDATEGLSNRDIETEMGNGEKSNGDPAMAAFEARGKRLGQENESEEYEEELEKLVKLFLLEIYGAFLLEGLLEMELDYGVESLESCFFGD
ncbi:hypothetical protein E5676_scaffold255G00090 [Cucumis melo var. makuwa]|uniref:Uncharacterized protein n=1 Tax=Cucumis melo var. makuwa TaxID=1194695 RepID=A0A5D3CMS2_CUCMM|nr:hypothetical protein E6C27_scaffold253G00480 [Cucumis melo var. makuwa]TYK12434.1 hypothetical protein E5676_scaffold255G00090 [Cucumis melo var. makuwa]